MNAFLVAGIALGALVLFNVLILAVLWAMAEWTYRHPSRREFVVVPSVPPGRPRRRHLAQSSPGGAQTPRGVNGGLNSDDQTV